jgi:hypothetical protein
MAMIPVVSLEHVGIVAQSGKTALSAAVSDAPLHGTPMPSGVTVAHFGPHDVLELIWPHQPGSPVEKYLTTRGPGLHHLALRVDASLDGLVSKLREAGFRTAGEVQAAADGRPSVFLHPSSTGGVLLELVQGERP